MLELLASGLHEPLNCSSPGGLRTAVHTSTPAFNLGRSCSSGLHGHSIQPRASMKAGRGVVNDMASAQRVGTLAWPCAHLEVALGRLRLAEVAASLHARMPYQITKRLESPCQRVVSTVYGLRPFGSRWGGGGGRGGPADVKLPRCPRSCSTAVPCTPVVACWFGIKPDPYPPTYLPERPLNLEADCCSILLSHPTLPMPMFLQTESNCV